MRKSISSYGSAVSKALMTLAMLLATVVMAKAQDPIPITEVNQVLTAGVPYSFKQYQAVYAQFNVPATGKLRVDGCKGAHFFEKCTNPGVASGYSEERNDFEYVTLDVRELQVTEGSSIYIVDDFPMDDGIVTLYMEGIDRIPLEIQYLQPTSDNEPVDFNNYPALQATFNQVVKLTDTNASISFNNRLTGNETTLTSKVTGSGTKMITVPFYTLLKPYIASEAIKPGDAFKVTVRTLVSEQGEPYVNADAEGNCVFNFICGSIPTVLVQSYCPNPFLSYWPEGTPEGVLKLTFNGPLGTSSKTIANIGWGNQEGEDGQYYTEDLPYTIDGNVLTVDFTGKVRTPATMTPMYPDSSYPNMIISISGIVDQYGVPVGSDGLGTVGTYNFDPKYELIERANIATEFEPASGADLAEASTVNVWISGIKSISFDGFKIEATDKNTDAVTTEIIEMKDVKVTPDGTDAAEYEFKMPQTVLDNAKSAVVTLNNVVSQDGYDHSNDVRAVYGGFVITYSEPANGAQLASINEGDIFTIETNLSEKNPTMYVEYQIVDTDPANPDEAIIKATSWMTRQEDGSYSSEVYGNYKLMYGKEYRVEFTAWLDEQTRYYSPEETLGSDFITLRGLTIPYAYSVTTLTDFQPAPDSLLPEDCTQLTVTFDGIVNLGRTSGYDPETGIVLGMGAGNQAFKEVNPVEPVDVDGTIYSTKWNLVFPDNYLASQTAPILISFRAYDEEGRVVKGNEGVDEASYFIYSFDVPGMYKDITVEIPENATSVSEITVKYPTGITPSWDIPYEDVKVFNRSNMEVAHMMNFAYDEDPENPFATITEGRIVLDTPIDEAGFYMLSIPRAFFNLGTEFSPFKNSEVLMPFSIAAPEFTAVPAEGNVSKLETIEVSFLGGDLKEGRYDGARVTWTSDNETYNAIPATIDGSVAILTIDPAITEPGTYHINIPAGFFAFTDGTDTPAVNLTYTIEAAGERPNITVDPEEGNVTSIPQSISIKFNDYGEAGGGMGKATLTIDGGAPINLPDAEFGQDWNEMIQGTGSDTEYTEKGTYVFSFPAGYFSLGGNGDPSPAFTLTYTIGDQDSVTGIDMNADSYTVFTVDGKRVLDRADRAAFKALAPGLYIVNGVKMIIK